MEMSPHTAERQSRLLATILFVTGLIFIAAGLAIGFGVDALGFILVAIGAVDLLMSRHFTPDRRGTLLPPGDATHADADLVAADAEPDATANPYARED